MTREELDILHDAMSARGYERNMMSPRFVSSDSHYYRRALEEGLLTPEEFEEIRRAETSTPVREYRWFHAYNG